MEPTIFLLLSLNYLWGAAIAFRSKRIAESSFFVNISACYALLAVTRILTG